MLFVFMVLNFADKSILGFAGVHIREDLGISPEQFGVVQSSFFWLFAVGAIIIGSVSSRIGVRWLLAILMMVWALTMAPLLGQVSFGVLLLCRIVLGLAEGPAFALANHAAHSWFPAEKRGLPTGIITAGASVGPLMAAPVLTWVIVTWSWHAAFGLLMVLAFIWTALWLIVGKSGHEGRSAHQAPTDDAPSQSALADVPFRTVLTTGTFVGICILMFISYWSTTLKVSWLPVYLSEGLGYDTITVGRLIMLPYGLAAVGAIGAGWMSNRMVSRGISRRVARGYFAGGLVLCSGVFMALFTMMSTGPLQMVLIALAFSLNSAASALAFVAVADVVHPRKRGAVLSFLVAFYSIGGAIGPLVLGYFVGQSENKAIGYGHGFALTGLLLIIGGIVALIMVRPDRDAKALSTQSQEVSA